MDIPKTPLQIMNGLNSWMDTCGEFYNKRNNTYYAYVEGYLCFKDDNGEWTKSGLDYNEVLDDIRNKDLKI